MVGRGQFLDSRWAGSSRTLAVFCLMGHEEERRPGPSCPGHGSPGVFLRFLCGRGEPLLHAQMTELVVSTGLS